MLTQNTHILMKLKRIVFLLFMGLIMQPGVSFSRSATVEDSLSVKMAESVIHRSPDNYGDWDYVTGTVLKAFQELWLATGDDRYFKYIKRTVDKVVNANGSIDNYKLTDYNIDEIREGSALLFLYSQTGLEKYRTAADLLRSQLEHQPRTSEGGFWHKQRYPNQMWLDGLYMGSPFYAEYGKLFNEPGAFDDVANQILLMEKHLKDSVTGLYFHGWDESREQEWADIHSGVSSAFWGRGMGWFAMALVDILDYLPSDHPKRDTIIDIIAHFFEAVSNHQDSETGLWYQVIDKPDSVGNYHEASASCMFVYAMAKAVRLNYVEPVYRLIAYKGYKGIAEHLITKKRGVLSINNICKSAGLGYGRDGTYNYYINETEKVSNDGKAIGPFILAALEFENLQHVTRATDEKQNINPVTLHPNPAKDNIVVTLNRKIDTQIEIKIINITGAPISTKTFIPSQSSLMKFNIADYKNGVYFMLVNMSGTTHIHKFIVLK